MLPDTVRGNRVKKPERLRPLYTEEGISHAIAETHVRRRNLDVREILEKILIHHS